MANWDKKDYYQKSESENEEEEALERLRLKGEVLQDNDFMPDFAETNDLDQLDEDEVIEIIERDSPELLQVLESIPGVIKSYKKAKLERDLTVIGFCKLLAVNISFYLMLKANGKSATNHPVVAQIKSIEKMIQAGQSNLQESEDYERISEDESMSEDESSMVEEPLEGQDVKRKVDEKIKRNKGIVKKRKKVERNVRVKNKMKYLKKVKIRRSTLGIREVGDRSKYTGETTGIRKNIIKSVKLT